MTKQQIMILNHLNLGRRLTVAEALQTYGIYALSQRVGELKRSGYDIRSRTVTSGDKHFSEYYLNKAEA